jgi:ABC-type branched-subunit amino acid transport system ATPase component/ABC-type branched-subunit amino acid transport system permease subunit
VFFRRARLGVAMRAVVDNPPLLDVQGRNPNAVRRWAWVIGASFAAASGVLLGPIVATLNAGGFLTIIISSFGAAAIGAFSSLPLTFIGGLLIGIAGDVASKYVLDVSWLAGLRGALPFLVLFVVLIVIPPNKLRERRVAPPHPIKPSYFAPPPIRLVFALVFIGFFALVPAFAGTDLSVWTFGLLYMILFASIGLLVKMSGQVSLCQTALAAVGGAAIAHTTTDWGLPWIVAVFLAGFIAAAVGLVIAVPAIRVSGVFLALATFGFGIFLQQMVYPTSIMFGTDAAGIPAPRPSWATGDTAYYYVVLAFAIVSALVLVVIHYGRLGRLARAMADSVLALNTTGTTVNVTRVSVFAISAFMAGIAGALYASASQSVYLGAPFYVPFTSLQLFAVVLLVLVGTPWFALLGAVNLEIAPYYLGKWLNTDFTKYLALLFGVGAVAIALSMSRIEPMPKPLVRFWERFRRRPADGVRTVSSVTREHPEGSGLQVRDLVVRYGGFLAVDKLNLHTPFGRITGLIGPNGAGKTTTFNACSGLVHPAGGRVLYNDADVTGLGPSARARRGIGRTFQIPELWNSLTVAQNVALGREASMAGGNLGKQLVAARGEPGRVAEEAAEALELAGITQIADRLVAGLSTGEKRLVELARVLAGPFDILLLDEPSSGLDTTEAHRFGEVLLRTVQTRGTGILLVEHDMTFVTQVCDYIYVMDFGLLIFEGTAPETMQSEIVRSAYLGSEVVTVGANGRAAGAVDPTDTVVG